MPCFPVTLRRASTWLALGLLLAGCAPRETVSYKSMFEPLLDPLRIADLEQGGARLLTTRLSSDDPSSPDAPAGWRVLADIQETGCLSHFWLTGIHDGSRRIRFYIDDPRTPIYETTLDHWFGQRTAATDHHPLRGYDAYAWFSRRPLSFAKRLLIMIEHPPAGETVTCLISLHQLPRRHTAESWKPAKLHDGDLVRDEDRMVNIWRQLTRTDITGLSAPVEAPAETETTLWQQGGPGTLHSLRIAPRWPGSFTLEQREEALRSLILRLYWDDHEHPSVDVPLAPLCGSMWHAVQYGSSYFGMSAQVYRLSFPMPFRTGARLSILNEGQEPLSVGLHVHSTFQDPPSSAGYFHAAWQRTRAQQTGAPHTLLQVTGRGKYVGCILGVASLDPDWSVLQGAVRIRPDGSGTVWHSPGIPPYFNGGRHYANAYAAPLHGLPFKAPHRTVQYRLHPHDPVAFDSSLHMTVQRGPQNQAQAAMESVAFYYLEAPAPANSSLETPAVRRPPEDPARAYTIMTEVNNFERLGDVPGAIDRIEAYLADFPDQPHNEVLRQRIQRYRDPHVIPDGQALLGLYANTRLRIFLNGLLIAGGGDSLADRVQFKPIDLGPGTHTLVVHYARQPEPEWAQLTLEYPGGFTGTDTTWKYAFAPGGAWTSAAYDDSAWPAHGGDAVEGPPAAPHIWTHPHDRPFTQSRACALPPPGPWPDDARFMVLRKTFSIPHPPRTGTGTSNEQKLDIPLLIP